MSYNIVSPEDFTQEQKQHMHSIKDALSTCFGEQEIIFYIKDVHSRYILGSDYYANLVGLSCGEDLVGLFDSKLPCKVAEFAQDFVDEEKELLNYKDGSGIKTTLKIYEYATGLESLIAHKYPIIHHPSRSILGIKTMANKIDLAYMLTLIPNELLEFGNVGSVESVQRTVEIDEVPLTEREHEVGFLMVMKWELEHIAHFMNKHRPLSTPVTSEIVHECQDDLCRKFKCEASHLREKLMEVAGLHKKIPVSFLKPLIGSRSC